MNSLSTAIFAFQPKNALQVCVRPFQTFTIMFQLTLYAVLNADKTAMLALFVFTIVD
jgi:hypothetical protein